MSQARPPDDTSDRCEDSPIAWFGEMLFALDRRDIDRAAEAKRQLTRLGWSVKYRKPRPDREGGTR
jgi:hypothetical protein